MGIGRNLLDKAMVRLHRDEYTSVPLRDYFRKTYGIEIGLYTFGAFDRWRVPPGTRIGRYCSIARNARFIDANHPMDALSTHPYFYESRHGVIAADRLHLRPQIVGDDVWIGHSATIAAGCHHIGRGAVIGAGAVVTRDVPPYAIVTGLPAAVARYRFDPETIAAIEESRWWELDRAALASALRAVPAFAEKPDPVSARQFRDAVRPLPGS
jgi:virginiamycin A acetyltransferase